MRLARGLLLAAGLSVIPMIGVVAVLLWGPTDSKQRVEAAADADYSGAAANSATAAPRLPRMPARPRTEKPPPPLDLRPSLFNPVASPPMVAAPADKQVDSTDDNLNLAAKHLNAAFQEKSGDRIAA